MIFKQAQWQKMARTKVMRYKAYSYGKLANLLNCSKSQAWKICNDETLEIRIDDFLLVCSYLEINPLDFIVRDEVQLKLL